MLDRPPELRPAGGGPRRLGRQPSLSTDRGFTGTNRSWPGLDQALAAVRNEDPLVVPKVDRLARSVRYAREIADQLAEREVNLQLGFSIHDPTDPMGKLFSDILATFAEFEANLIGMRPCEGMTVACAKGKLRGKRAELRDRQQRELRRMYDTGNFSVSDLAELSSISQATMHRTLARTAEPGGGR